MTDLSIYINRERRQIREKQRFSKLDEIRNVGKIRESNIARQIIGTPHKAAAQVLPAKLPFRVFRRPFRPADTNVVNKKFSRLSRFSRLNYITSGTNSFTLRKPHHSHSSRLLVFHLSTLYNTIRIYIEIFIELISLSIQLNYRLTKEVTLKIILRLIRSQHCRLLKH